MRATISSLKGLPQLRKLTNTNIWRIQNANFFGNKQVQSVFQTRNFTSTIDSTAGNLASTAASLGMESVIKLVKKVEKASFLIKDSAVKNSPASKEAFNIIDEDLKKLNNNIFKLLDTKHTLLSTMARYYFHLEGKRFRPTIMLLISKAIQESITNSTNSSVDPKQLQLAEIIEMIHTASLLHDDVLDASDLRRGVPSIQHQYKSNKFSILAGDYLLAKASLSLATLENHEVTKLISTVISDLVEGEFMQTKSENAENFDYYMRKTYLKTASLIANSCRATAVLVNAPPEVVEMSTQYGKNVGLAFQIVDDLLDFTGTSDKMGKPVAVDLSLGIATAPVLFALEQFPELKTLIKRNFQQSGDVERALELVRKNDSIKRTHDLANLYAQQAIQSLSKLSPSVSKEALINLANLVVTRNQ